MGQDESSVILRGLKEGGVEPRNENMRDVGEKVAGKTMHGN